MSIRDQGYTRFEGDLSSGSPAWWVIAANDLKLYWSYIRTKLLFVFLMIFPLLFGIGTFLERVVVELLGAKGAGADKPLTGMFEYAFGYVEVWMLVLMLAAAGCGVIADDMRHKTIQLYFSKPIHAWQYVVGKPLSLLMLGAAVTVLPTVLVGGIRLMVFSPDSTKFLVIAKKVGALLAWDCALLLTFSLIVMALSCLSRRSGYVFLSWMGTVLVPSVVATIVGLVRRGDDWPEMLSLVGSFSLGLQTWVGYKGMPEPGQLDPEVLPDYLTWAPWLVILGVCIAAGGVIYWRTSKLEGIT